MTYKVLVTVSFTVYSFLTSSCFLRLASASFLASSPISSLMSRICLWRRLFCSFSRFSLVLRWSRSSVSFSRFSFRRATRVCGATGKNQIRLLQKSSRGQEDANRYDASTVNHGQTNGRHLKSPIDSTIAKKKILLFISKTKGIYVYLQNTVWSVVRAPMMP